MPSPAPLCLITEGQMIPCDAVFVIECGHDSDAGGFPVLADRPAPAVVRYWRLEARKQPGRHSQPRAPFAIDEIAEGIVS